MDGEIEVVKLAGGRQWTVEREYGEWILFSRV